MTNNVYNIQPVTVGRGLTTGTATTIGFLTSYVPFEKSMPFSYTLTSADGQTLYSGQGVVDETLLSMWGEDDNYIINVMATMVGVTVIW